LFWKEEWRLKNMYDVKEIQRLYAKYGSMKRIAREMKISRNTVSKYLKRLEEFRNSKKSKVIYKESASYTRIPQATIERMHSLLEENKSKPVNLRYTAKKIWQMVIPEGYDLSYTSVKRIVKRWKEENTLIHDVYIEQVPKVWKHAEFDWGYTSLTINSVKKMYPTAFMVLNESLYRYTCVFEKETNLEVVQSHIDFFNEIGGVPESVFYDNLKVVVDNPKTKKINKRFLEFSSFYEFIPIPCNPKSPNEKGTTEETVGFVRNWCFSEKNEFDSLQQANEYLKDKLTEINSNHIYKRELPPIEGVKRERNYFRELPKATYNNYVIEKRMVSSYSTVMFERNHYSVPENCRARSIILKVYPDKIEMFDSQHVIATHKRIHGRGQYSIRITHYLSTLKRKPGSLKNSRAFQTLSEKLRTMYDKYYTRNTRDFIEVLSLLKEHKEEKMVKAINELFSYGVIPTYETLKKVLEQKPEHNVKSLNTHP
jgi:transposase